jgi:hypothetical protein
VARARVAGRLPVVSTVRSLSPMSRVIRPHIMGACTWGSSRGVHVRLGVPGVYVDEDRAPNETIRTLSGRRGLDRQLSEYGRSPVGGGRSASATQYVSTVLVVGRPGSYARSPWLSGNGRKHVERNRRRTIHSRIKLELSCRRPT